MRAGPLALDYEAGDLRYVRFGEREVLRRVYVAVRDRNWDTVPGRQTPVVTEIGADSFRIVYDMEHRQGEIGFTLHPDHQGHGYATEAAEAIVELAFGTYGLHRVCAGVEPRNTASVRVLERLGMRKEAHLIETAVVKGEWSSEAVYAILAREWSAARERG